MKKIEIAAIAILLSSSSLATSETGVRLKDIARVDGAHESALIGYGIVVGLSGSGDSGKNKLTRLSLANTLANFGVKVTEDELNARNSAAVIVTSSLSSFAEIGDKIDVQVASLGDANSLAGGTLVLTPLYGPDRKLYALSQGTLTVGGYRVDSFSDSAQKNFPTVGRIPHGATIEASPKQWSLYEQRRNNTDEVAHANEISSGSHQPQKQNAVRPIEIVLHTPDAITAQRIAEAVQRSLFVPTKAIHPGKVIVEVPFDENIVSIVSKLEIIEVLPDAAARIVVNERTGTIVSGGNIKIGAVTVTHGALQIKISTEFNVSQPIAIGRTGAGVNTVVVPDTNISVTEEDNKSIDIREGATVSELTSTLLRINVSTREIISILQSIRSAGALHAEIVLQ